MNFVQIAHSIDVLPVVLELQRHPGLWRQHTARTEGESPHAAVDDIWLRFRDSSQLVSAESYAESFVPVFYPAWHALPALRPLVFALMQRVGAVQLGLILITRVPPGEQVLPHDDRGRWGAEFFNTKVYLPLVSNDRCVNTCDDETIMMRTGEAWTFDNLKRHATINDGTTDRVTLIVSMRCE